MFDALKTQLRGLIEGIAPGPETLARRESLALQRACCSLLMEIARLESSGTAPKRGMVSNAMQLLFQLAQDEIAPMIELAGRQENRLTSYFKPVALINKRLGPGEKAHFIELLWRVAMADGKIDMYEEQLVRKLADLLYVPHSDFILAKHRVQNGS